MDIHVYATSGSIKIEYPKFLRMNEKERSELALVYNAANPAYLEPLKMGLYMPGAKSEGLSLSSPSFEEWLEALALIVHGVSRAEVLKRADHYRDRAFFPLLVFDTHSAYGPKFCVNLCHDFANFFTAVNTYNEPLVCGKNITKELFSQLYNDLKSAFETAYTGLSGFVLIYSGDEGIPA